MQIKRVRVAPELITKLLTAGNVLHGDITVLDGLPPGSILAGITCDVDTRDILLEFYHPSFLDLPADCPVPEIFPVYQVHQDTPAAGG